MVQLSLAFIAAVFVSVQASPLFEKRIAQIVSDSLELWQDACLAASQNSLNCNDLAVTAYNTLLAAAGPCDQQNSADAFIDFAKQQPSSSSQATMISLSQIFVQQARNSPMSQSIPYCQVAPKNAELTGLFQCQWVDNNPTVFAPGVNVGQPGTIPFGMKSPVHPPGGCPAHPSGPIPDGTQLVDITTIPIAGAGGAGAGAATSSSSGSTALAANSNSGPITPATLSSTGTVLPPTLSTAAPNRAVVSASMSASASVPSSSLAAIIAANIKLAQQENAGNETLTPSSSCTLGDNGCIDGKFAECTSNGTYALTPCATGLTCYILPLLKKNGTSPSCDTEADAISRGAIPSAVSG